MSDETIERMNSEMEAMMEELMLCFLTIVL